MNDAIEWIEETRPRRFCRYSEYKDSGVSWLGKIPAHWNAKRLKFLVLARTSKLDTKPHNAVYIGLEHVESWTGQLLLETQPESVDSVVSSFASGDVLFGKLRPYLAKAARPDFDGVCTSEIIPLRPTPECFQSYMMYCLLNAPYIRWLNSMTYGTKMPRVSPAQVESSHAPLPPEFEQRAIAAFLDRETAKIDGLVARKERLIELLQEKRTTLITHAVTRGLDPLTGTRTTGSNVFPIVPKDWILWKIRRLIRRVRRPIVVRPDMEYQEIGIRSWGKGIFHKDPVRGALLGEKSVFRTEPGDFVLNIVFAWEGAVAVVSRHEKGMIASHRFPTFRPFDYVDLDYLLMILQSDQGRRLMEVNSPGAAGRNKTLRIGQFLEEELPLPNLAGQRATVASFREKEGRLSTLVS